MQRVTALVGAQYGSEGKGLVAYHLRHRDVHVRTGAPNAGHTIYHQGRKYAMQQIPCGWTNPTASLIIGPGAVVDLDQLELELRFLLEDGYQVSEKLVVDAKASVLDPVRHHAHEGGVDGVAHKLIGSTGHGVGPARMARIARGTFGDSAWAHLDLVEQHRARIEALGVKVGDTASDLNRYIDQGYSVLLEGTQGSGLSLTHGPWPYVTSNDTNAAQLCADAGLSPHRLTDTILVARMFPIRVAGNSGPLNYETSWEELGLQPEYTTVTKKKRRVAWWDDNLFLRAVMLNQPCNVVLTFTDYRWPECRGVTSWARLGSECRAFCRLAEEFSNSVRVIAVGTGPDTMAWRDDNSLEGQTDIDEQLKAAE